MIDRHDLPDGQWVDTRRSPDHAQYKAIMVAAERAATGAATMVEWASVVGRQMTEAWRVLDGDGKPLALDDEGWATAPAEIVDAACTLAQEAWSHWQANRRPLVTLPSRKDEPPTSSGTSENSSADTSAAAPSTSST